MRRRLEYGQDLEKKLKGIIKTLIQEEIKRQAYAISKACDPLTSRKGDHDKIGGRNNYKPPGGASRPTKQKPICLYPPHKGKGLHHLLKDCPDCPLHMNDKLFEEMRAPKKDALKRTTSDVTYGEASSIIFSATLANKLQTKVCADIGADVSILDATMLSKMEKAGIELHIENLSPP